MIRFFIAIELPADLRAAIEEAQARLKRVPLGVRVSWARVSNLHLTLQFLGCVEELILPRISQALETVACQHELFNVSVQGAGAFPDKRRPRVLWIGCQDEAGQLKRLAAAVQAAIQPLGFTPEQRPFTAHLTLGRIKPALSKVEGSPRPDDALTRALDSLTNAAFGMLRVDAIHLFQSQLHAEGSIYTKLSSHNLKEI